MSGLVENFIRRIEKKVTERATVPTSGTNHVDDNWLVTDIYPGELAINQGSLYTSDGRAIIDLNKENMILSGMILSKDTSGVRKLTVSSGHVRINGIHYYHASATGSGTDILLPPNIGAYNELYFIYAQTSDIIATGHPGASGDLKATIGYVSKSGLVTEPGLFSEISTVSGVPPIPSDAILLGTVLVPVGAIGYELWPRSVANMGDYYPKFSITPSEFLRQSICEVSHYQAHSLFFPGEFVIDDISNTIYLSKNIFVSDYASISGDISIGNLIPIGGSGGTGASGAMTVSNLGTGATVFAQTISSNIQLRSILGTSPVQVTYGPNEITVSLDASMLMGVTNLGFGSQLYRDTTANIARLRSIVGGLNVSVVQGTNDITISVPNIGTTAQGANIGSGLTVYAGMSGKDLTFKTIGFTGGLTASVTSNEIIISGDSLAKQGQNLGSGPVYIYAGMTGQNLAFYGLSGGANVELSVYGGNTIVISASGGSGSTSAGINVGTGYPVYAGMSGSDLTFYSLYAGNGISIGMSGNDVLITADILDGEQGPSGPQGVSGINGTNGVNGAQGPQGLRGSTGADSTIQGPQGFQGFGYQGPQGMSGFQGPMGPQGTPVDMRFIDVYNNSTSVSVTNGAPALMVFDAIRTNTGLTALYQPIGTTSIQINESGNYQFIYNLTFTVPFNSTGKFYLYKVNATPGSERVDGSDVYAVCVSGSQNVITATGKVGLTCSAGDIYGVYCTTNTGTITSYVDASSFMITKLEIGVGPQGPAIEGPQGAVGSQGGAGPTGDALVSVQIPLTGNGALATPVELMYSSDFILNGLQQLYLNLDFTTLVTPTLQRTWQVYKDGGIAPFPTTIISSSIVGPTMTSTSITVPTGCIVSYGGTATIPATGPGEAFPTGVTGNWSMGLTGPTSSYISYVGITANSSYSLELTKTSEGLGITGSISDMSTWRIQRATGIDSKSVSDTIQFDDVFYWGTCSSLGTGNINQVTADTVSISDVQNLINHRFGSQAQTFTGVTDTAGSRLIIAFPDFYPDLSDVILDGGVPILGAFFKKTSNLTITTLSGIPVSYKVYVAVADNSYSNNQITTI